MSLRAHVPAPRATLLAVAVLMSTSVSSWAQQAAVSSPSSARVERVPDGPMNAEETRKDFIELLNRHPPSVGRVIKLDPSLMRNDAYLSAYPQVRQFLVAHPEIAQNAAYYLDPVRFSYDTPHSVPRNPQLELIETTLSGVAAFVAFGVGIGMMFWLIRTVIDQRRWNRLSKIQADVHMKLMDRFSSNDELLGYVQTPSGRRFLESGPSPLPEPAPASIGAPFARILWSVQIGAVLAVAGIGVLALSNRPTLPEARDFFYILGCITTALGGGFLVSAAAAYFLSRRFGLIDSQSQTHA